MEPRRRVGRGHRDRPRGRGGRRGANRERPRIQWPLLERLGVDDACLTHRTGQRDRMRSRGRRARRDLPGPRRRRGSGSRDRGYGGRRRCSRRRGSRRGRRCWDRVGSRDGLLDGVRSRGGQWGRRHSGRRRRRCRCRSRSRSSCRGLGCRRRIADHDRARARVGTTRREERRRVDVSLILVGVPNPELHVGATHLGVATRADRPDAVTFGDRHALGHGGRPELRERHRPAVGRQDGDRPSAPGHRSGERHRAGGGRLDRLSRRAADIESAMLSTRIGMRGIERVPEQDRPARRPRPRVGGGREH